MIRDISTYKSKCKLKFNHFLFLPVTFRSSMLCFKTCKFNDKLIMLMSRWKVKFCHKNEKKEPSNATFWGRVENYISLICWFKCLLEYTLEFIGLYGMLLTLCHLQVESTAFFGNGPNKVDRPSITSGILFCYMGFCNTARSRFQRIQWNLRLGFLPSSTFNTPFEGYKC